jgi:hypothetical protein
MTMTVTDLPTPTGPRWTYLFAPLGPGRPDLPRSGVVR